MDPIRRAQHASSGANHAVSHRFDLQIDQSDYNLGSWSKLSGLAIKWDKAEAKQGASDAYFKYAGQPKYDNLKFARAVDQFHTSQVQKWLGQVHTGGGNHGVTGEVSALDAAGNKVLSWPLKNIFPIEWSIQDFDSGSGKVAIETLTIAHEGLLGDEFARNAQGGGRGAGLPLGRKGGGNNGRE